MRNFKKFLTLVLAVMMVVSSFAFSTSAAAFTDVSADDDVLTDAVNLLSYVGIAKGVSDTEFGTEQAVTRQQFALFVYRLLKGGKDAPANGNNTTRFEDLTDATYFYAISWANSQGIVNGKSATSFDPTGTITLQEAYAMLVRALGYEEDGEVLAYPYEYIEVAEQTGVELDEGLDSKIGYTDALTRGDMAILLYNTFFAETGRTVVREEERQYQTGTNAGESFLVEVEYNPILCEEAFDVVRAEYQAVATPHYTIATQKVTDDLGYSAAMFELRDDITEDIERPAPALQYVAAEDIDVAEDKLDDSFLAIYELFFTLDDDGDIDTVLYANTNKTVKTVNDLKFETVSSNKVGDYFDSFGGTVGAGDSNTKVLSGKATTGTDVIYFYDAPYSYITPDYTGANDEQTRYGRRNAGNITVIDFDLTDVEEGYYQLIETANPYNNPYAGATPNVFDKAVIKANAEALVGNFAQAYYGGLYEADLYDIDGDGVYDSIDYKPYEFFQVDTDEDYTYSVDAGNPVYQNGTTLINKVFTNEANITGEEFENEDFVIGYYNFNGINNEIKVAAVVEPTKATIKTARGNNVLLADGTTVDARAAWKMVSNYGVTPVYDFAEKANETIPASANLEQLLGANVYGEEVEMYVYDGVVFYQDGATSSAVKYANNLLVPVTLTQAPTPSYDAKSGEFIYYVKAYVDGSEKVIPLNTEDVYPEIVVNDVFSTTNYTTYYENQLCVYSVGADGLYTITSLEHASEEPVAPATIATPGLLGVNQFENVNYYGNEAAIAALMVTNTKDADLQFVSQIGNGVVPTKIIGNRYSLGVAGIPEVTINDDTKIVIKNTKTNGKVEWKTIPAAQFDTVAASSALNNVSVLITNDVNSGRRENLVVLYGETTNFKFENNTAITSNNRIISDINVGIDEEGYYRNYYTILNPFDGSKTENVAGTYSAGSINNTLPVHSDVKVGAVVKVTDAGLVNDEDPAKGAMTTGNGLSDAGLVWIREYNAANKVLDVVPVSDNAVLCWQDVENYNAAATNRTLVMGEKDENDAVDFFETTVDATSYLYQVDNNTVVTVLKGDASSDGIFKWGSFSLSNLDALNGKGNDNKVYNTKVAGNNNTYKTGYAKYLKAYISLSDEGDTTPGREEMPTVAYVIIVAHEVSTDGMLATHTNVDHTANPHVGTTYAARA